MAEQPGRTANDVVSVTPMDKGIVSRAVKGLLDMELLTRVASQDDGRLGHLYLTEKGERRYDVIAAEVRKVEDDLLAAMSEKEQRALGPLLARLIGAMGG